MPYQAGPNIKFQSEQKWRSINARWKQTYTSSDTHVTGGGMQKMLNPFFSICWNMIKVVIIF